MSLATLSFDTDYFVVHIFMPGPKFGVYCMKHLLLPMLQSWLRSGSRKYGYWDVGATNFKQCCGHTTDLVVDMIHDFKGMFLWTSLLLSVVMDTVAMIRGIVVIGM